MSNKKSYEELSAERKQLIAQNEIPEWMTTQGYIMFRNKYAYNGETVRSRFQTIAKTLAKYLPFEHQETAEQKFFDIMWKGHLAPSTPVYCNTGTNRGHSVSCSGSYIEDSIDGFYSALREMALLSKNGYGTSAYLGDIRPRGTPISVGGEADGVVPVFDMFTRTAQLVSQGNNRRGSWAGYIDMDHGDFDEMNDYVLKNPGEANIGYNFTDEFIDRLGQGDAEAIRRYTEMMYTRSRFGKGYIWKSDVANRLAPECIRQTGEKVRASNLCFTGDTLVAVADGRNAVAIEQLAKESNGTVKFPVYCSELLPQERIRGKRNGGHVNSGRWGEPVIKNAVAFKTGTKQVVEVTLENGDKFKCTPDHQLATRDGNWVAAADSLGIELKSMFTFTPAVGSKYRHINSLSNANAKQHRLIWEFYNRPIEKGFVIDHISPCREKSDDRLSNLQLMPVAEHLKKSAEEKTGADNSINRVRDRDRWVHNTSIQSTGKNNPKFTGIDNFELIELGKKVQELHPDTPFTFSKYLSIQSELGIRVPSSFSKYRFGGSFEKYRNYVLGLEEYQGECEDTRQPISNNPDEARQDYINKYFYRSEGSMLIKSGLKVVDIKPLNEEVDVYDLTVEEHHNFYIITSTEDDNYDNCQGVLVHNCTEIALPASEELTFSCVLSSLNLAKWDEFDEDTIFWSLVFLDCVCSHSLIQMQTTPGLEKIARFTEKYRALGLGALGFHTYLQSKMIPIDSLQASFENMAIFRKIHDETLRASQWLAEILGECEVTKGYGIRNSTRTAIAPNMSSAVLCGGVSQGIEPFVSNTFTQNTAAGNMVRINPEFIKVLKKYDKYNDDIVRDINDNYQGSVQHLDFLTDEEKAVFKTAFEINQSALVRLAAQRQKFICQGQSLNLFFVEDEEYISEVTREALENPNIKGLYYQRSTRLTRGSNPRGECIACEG